ncbi:hypothetical protein GCM10027176_84240 [Actinoallomurus bryophytorum]|uniref:Uncharacterized protein n=1 Tax=Actinoallomurus bryophytorum TaxID=1490222 RepID=A0A543CT86_9ACTN|nr:hypothetical protein [Actinoallomurus bryophytorum]TQM00320.1 hypothetical protein FB559_6031 [Actinoallomurus bryophytorum]
MMRDSRANAAHGHRWALWLFLFVGVVLQSGLCPPNTHAGVLGATARPCFTPTAGAPPEVEGGGHTAGSGRATDAGRPCAPAPRPHHHPPCGVMTHRGAPQQRSIAAWQTAAMPRCPEPAVYAAESGGPGLTCPPGRSSRPPAPRSGARLLIDLCASRT